MRFFQFLLLSMCTAIGAVAASDARATTVLIDSTVTGCFNGSGACGGGPANLPPGALVNLINPATLTLGPGTYSITNAALTGYYSAWNFSSGWVWSFGITTDNNDGTGNVFHLGYVGGVFGSQVDAATIHAGTWGGPGGPTGNLLNPTANAAEFYDTFTLAATTKLDFFTLDYYPYDNAGGVALEITSLSQTPLPAALPLFAGGLGALGLLGWRRRRNAAAGATP